ncbi:hypothetical protein PFI50_22760, partial [Mycobacterium xenopi]|nr:hypothetical protein [Mycobacterium xenopi]
MPADDLRFEVPLYTLTEASRYLLIPRPTLTEFLGASLAIYGGVSPSRMSPGVARRSKRSGLAVDVLLDDR